MWRTVSFRAAQASSASCSEAQTSASRDVWMVPNTGCRNSRRMPRPINRNLNIEPPHVGPAILNGIGSEPLCRWPKSVPCRDRKSTWRTNDSTPPLSAACRVINRRRAHHLQSPTVRCSDSPRRYSSRRFPIEGVDFLATRVSHQQK